ncbi:hypothetical protein QVD17_17163 [Tagetes erecta]|uniref:Protein TIFY n=1 Tax=Tagetes erecta TaxID=13708 RepID=A0AAD8KRS8_TARER|nr:hypothetical protein QVD17_17163 [Tagetes erecta]
MVNSIRGGMGWQVAAFPLVQIKTPKNRRNCPKPTRQTSHTHTLFFFPQILILFPKLAPISSNSTSIPLKSFQITTMSTEDPPITTSTISPLDKPLHLLTEDDISQLTREDCRRYLKQKGMRRPSWNKSQAIQQVIMLKALLEPSPDSDDGGRKHYITSRQQQTPATRVQKGTSADTEISLSAEESVPGQRNDTEKSDVLGDNDSAPPGIIGVEETKGQMTIFYNGKVNVYDDIPADKAQALFQLAASPLLFSHEDPVDGNMLHPPSINVGRDFPPVLSPILQTGRMADNHRLHKEESNIFREDNSVRMTDNHRLHREEMSREDNSAEGSASRKASVQRYLEKRKDRFKSKRKSGATFDVLSPILADKRKHVPLKMTKDGRNSLSINEK